MLLPLNVTVLWCKQLSFANLLDTVGLYRLSYFNLPKASWVNAIDFLKFVHCCNKNLNVNL